jgi:hypothetical protein
LTFLDSPLGKAVKLLGCQAHMCGTDAAGRMTGERVSWIERRKLPHTFRLLLHGHPLQCPAATAPPATWPVGQYAVVYQITGNGRCVITQHSPPN